MDASVVWGFIPEAVEALDRTYDLLSRTISDLQHWIRKRKKAKMKLAVIQIRSQVGEIDAIFSRLKAKMQIAVERDDKVGFNLHQRDIEQIYFRVTSISMELQTALGEAERYLDNYPKLRDALHIKVESEGVDDYDDEPEIYQDLQRFTHWVHYVSHTTRNALEMLNEHLESEY